MNCEPFYQKTAIVRFFYAFTKLRLRTTDTSRGVHPPKNHEAALPLMQILMCEVSYFTHSSKFPPLFANFCMNFFPPLIWQWSRLLQRYYWLDASGLKKCVGCSHAIFPVRSIVDQYVSNGSTVNICALDISKAFDKMNHHCLFIKLMERYVPITLLSVHLTKVEQWLNQSSRTDNRVIGT